MNIIHKLTLHLLKQNKKRTLVTILGVVIATAMVTATASGIFSGLHLLRQTSSITEGEWHIRYTDFTAEKVKYIPKGEGTRLYTLANLGFGKIAEPVNEKQPYILVKALDKEAFSRLPMTLEEGRLPENDRELAVSTEMLKSSKKPLKIGDTVTYELGQRMFDDMRGKEPDEISAQSNYRVTPDGNAEYLAGKTTKTYRIVGTIDDPQWFNRFGAGQLGVTRSEAAQLPAGTEVEVRMIKERPTLSIYKEAADTAQKISGSYADNGVVLATYLVIRDPQILLALVSVCLVLFGLIMVAGVSLIYNAFSISVAERSRQLGMLASVGATKKQKRDTVFLEGAAIGAVSIPLGMGAGLLGMWITFQLVNPLLDKAADYVGMQNLKLIVNVPSMVLAIFISMLTIFISVYKPALAASRTSPMEALRQTKDVRIKGKTVKTSKLTRLLFGMEGDLALKNLKRNRRRYRATVLSLFMSIVLFLGVFGFSGYMEKMIGFTMKTAPYDILVHNNGVSDSGTIAADAQKTDRQLLQVAGAAKAWRERFAHMQGRIPASMVTQGYKNYAASPYAQLSLSMELVALSPENMAQKIKAAGLSEKAFYGADGVPAIVINRGFVADKPGGKSRPGPFLNWKAGQQLSPMVEKEDTNGEEYESSGIIFMGVIEEVVDTVATTVYIPESAVGKLDAQYQEEMARNVVYFYESDAPEKLQENLEQIKKEAGANISISNLALEMQGQKQMLRIVQIFTLGFISLMALICVANIFNTISTSIGLRRKEFAMLKSVGMTPGGFQKMIRFESLFYGLKALLWGLPVGVLLNYTMFHLINRGVSFTFTLPWGAYLGVVGAVFLIVGCTMAYSTKKMKKENIIDALKDENT